MIVILLILNVKLFMESLVSEYTTLNMTGHAAPIAVAKGDGIGPEIMEATLKILLAAGARIRPVFVEMGAQQYLSGNTSGISLKAWDAIRENKVLLKAPMTTPQGSGYKSLNVTLRKSLGLFANVRPCLSLYPYVDTKYPETDVVIIRENEEDLYAGIEHQQTTDVVQCLKLITRPGSERIIRYAFEYARVFGRKKVTCMVKDNIMKLTDGLFHKVFNEIGAEYPDIIQEVQIIDIATARLATQPGNYDVIVTSNLYGDIISDVAAEVVGSVGLAGSSNIGTEVSMFEAIHGSAPDIAGKNIANPSGLINAAVMMLEHIGQQDVAGKVRNALLRTIEDGYHTADIYHPERSTEKVSTSDFADEVISRMGLEPETLPVYSANNESLEIEIPPYQRPNRTKTLVGVDIFIDNASLTPNEIGDKLSVLANGPFSLKMITNRGVKVYPDGLPETFCTDHWRCRFVKLSEGETIDYDQVSFREVLDLQSAVSSEFDIIKTENLYKFDNERSFSLGQGE